ncbi:hypothetical protein [Millisia brevis]|uniref:hypothetical protein n=1 Tax=Millisia brevis TaxID=264148 RepID=UPI00083628B7|nr:hypothetical protein [Millisia brevis]
MGDGDVLRIEPGAAERIARALDLHAENLATALRSLRNRGHVTGFAGFPSAMELDAGFADKARLAVEHLQQQIIVANDAAATIRRAGAAYNHVEDVNSANIHAAGAAPDSSTGQ